MKTSELIGAQLDWAVLKALGVNDIGQPDNVPFDEEFVLLYGAGDFAFSTDWALGGPIIEREEITVQARKFHLDAEKWKAFKVFLGTGRSGPTSLIAAMRCFVASKLGDGIEIPKELF